MQGKPKKSTIGLSLGTTDSCVGIWINEQIEILTDDEGCRNIKSYVAFTESGCIVGNEAYNQALQNPKNTVYDIKLLIGKKYHELEALKTQRKWPFEIEPDFNERPLITVTNNKENLKLYPEQIYAMIIAKLKRIAEDRLGFPVTDAVISMPATFNRSQREATKHAVTIAGLNPLRLIKEPVAATVGSEIEKIESDGKEIAVISIGRTKAEVCMLSKLDDIFELVAVYNCPDLSGDILDGILLDHCVEQFQQITGQSVQNVPQAIKRLKKAVEKAKIALSSSLETTIDLDSLCQGEDFTYTLTRKKFEELCSPAFEKLTPIFKKSLEACDKTLFGDVKIKKILLIGGSTQIPKIADIASKFFSGLKPINLKNSGEVIAGGAAALAAFLGNAGSKRLEQLLIIDATGMPLGIKAAEGKMAQVIRQGHAFPCKVPQIFTTFQDNQLSVTIEVYEGSAEMVHENHFVGKFILNGISPALKGVPQIKVTFSLDNFGILSVEAQEETGAQNKIEVVFEKGGFAPAEIQQLLNKNQQILNSEKQIIED